jgi:N6-L-threonylcarbamoyladenine synthase
MGIETSCDETSVAVIDGDHEILGHVILSQDVHEVFGGVVPELAARAHLQRIDAVVARVLEQAGVDMHDVDVFGVTAGPGLIGALLVGVCWAKAVAFATGRPLVAVHHMEAHLFGPSLEDPSAEPPFVGRAGIPCWGRHGTTQRARPSTRRRSASGLPTPAGPRSKSRRPRGIGPGIVCPAPC